MTDTEKRIAEIRATSAKIGTFTDHDDHMKIDRLCFEVPWLLAQRDAEKEAARLNRLERNAALEEAGNQTRIADAQSAQIAKLRDVLKSADRDGAIGHYHGQFGPCTACAIDKALAETEPK